MGASVTRIKASSFNLVGINFVQPASAIGTVTASAANTITDAAATFTNALQAGTPYYVEVVSGQNTGLVTQVTAFDATNLTTSDDIDSFLDLGDRYVVRASATLATIFGAANEAGLQAGSATSADLVWIGRGDGGFDKFYYAVASPPFTTAGWKRVGGGNTNQSATPIFLTDAVFLQRKVATDLDLITTGEVKTTRTIAAIESGFNLVNRIYPTGATLASTFGDTNQNGLNPGSATSADLVWLPNAVGGFDKFYYAVASPPFTTAGWKRVGGGNTNQATTALTSGVLIQRKGAPLNLTIDPPAGFDDL
jgi:hypothetical protein